jgi:hypothetical protein
MTDTNSRGSGLFGNSRIRLRTLALAALALAAAACTPATSRVDESATIFRSGASKIAASAHVEVELSLSDYGCAGDVRPAGTGVRTESGTRVEYRHAEDDLIEWYERDARGVEQGFTLNRRPCANRDSDLEIDVKVAGLSPRPAVSGVELLDEHGAVRMHYTDLTARDALGKALKSTMSVKDGRIALRVASRNAVYPVVVDPELWSQEGARLGTTDGAAQDKFGTAVSVSGDTAVVGAPTKNVGANTDQGAAYIYVRTGTVWAQQGSSLPRTDAASGDQFGASVSISGGTVVVGAPNKTVNTNTAEGAAYIYVRNGTTWTQQGPALPESRSARFGGSVSVSGDTVVVGAPSTGGPLGQPGQGIAHVFVRNGTTWTEQQALELPASGTANDAFGSSVSVSGDTAVVGASGHQVGPNARQGAGYIFVRSGTVWTQQGASLGIANAAADDSLGSSVSISSDTVLIGASGRGIGGSVEVGAAFVFVRTNTTWTQQGSALTSTNGTTGSQFGAALSVSGDTALVGAPGEVVTGNVGEGNAYLFARSGGQWVQQGNPLSRADGAQVDQFGASISVSGNTVLVGASAKKIGANISQGAAYAFIDGPCTTDLDCPGGSCANAVCFAPCAHDSDCSSGAYCSAAGLCRAQAKLGGSCSEMAGTLCKQAGCAVCASGQCVDGRCCDSICDGQCQACAATLTGGVDGTCGAVLDGQDPHDDCATDPDYPAS